MQVLRTAAEVRAWRAGAGRVGLVPTMGALHEGHRSHVLRAAAECDAALVTIFVNPRQFAPGEDLAAYPRREPEDLALIAGAGGSAVLMPSVAEMYPPGDDTRVVPGAIAASLEGAARPGHFTGVATVVVKLLAMTRPDVAYFGQKDFQQLRVIQTVTGDLALGVRIAGGVTVREPDGLAMSSRNAYLAPNERARAVHLSRGLFAARDLWEAGERDPRRLRATVAAHAAPAGALEYVSAADPFTLAELAAPAERAVLSLAARVGRARLIDNVLLGMDLADLT